MSAIGQGEAVVIAAAVLQWLGPNFCAAVLCRALGSRAAAAAAFGWELRRCLLLPPRSQLLCMGPLPSSCEARGAQGLHKPLQAPRSSQPTQATAAQWLARPAAPLRSRTLFGMQQLLFIQAAHVGHVDGCDDDDRERTGDLGGSRVAAEVCEGRRALPRRARAHAPELQLEWERRRFAAHAAARSGAAPLAWCTAGSRARSRS